MLTIGSLFKGQDGVRVEGLGLTRLYSADTTQRSEAQSQTKSSFLGIGIGKSNSTDIQLKTQSLASQLISSRAIKIGVGARTELRGADLQAPSIEFIRSAGADPSTPGQLILSGDVNTTSQTHQSQTISLGLWQKTQDQGSQTENLQLAKLQGQVSFAPGINLSVQTPTCDLPTHLATLGCQDNRVRLLSARCL